MATKEGSAPSSRERPAVITTPSAPTSNGNGHLELDDMPSSPIHPIQEDLMALARLGELRSIQRLFDSGKASATSADPQSITALHWAAINGHYALCHYLIESGANVNAKGGDAEATPVLWASKRCHLDVVNLLLQQGADPLLTDDQGYNLLHSATLDGNVFQLILLLHQADVPVDIPDSQGHTSLMWAAYKGFPACLDVLLKWGADVHARDDLGFTALHWALVKGSYNCIQKLVEYGADRFVANNEGKTPAVTAKDMNSTRQWHRALSDCGFDPSGNPRTFPLTFVKDTKKFLERFFFAWPFFVLGVTLYILSIMPAFFLKANTPQLSSLRHRLSTTPTSHISFTSRLKMPSINVSLKDGADASQLDAAKKQVTEQGGKITTEFKLIKGFTAEFPEDKVHTLSSNDHINVENDGEVRTQ